MTKITIRKMRRSDFSFAIRLTDTMNWDLTERDFTFMMELEPKGCFVASADAKRVGITTTAHFGKIGCIGNVIVDAQYRSKGIGVKLVKEATRYLADKSASTITLYAYQNTVKFYEKMGFKADYHLIRFTGKGQKNQETYDNVRAMTQHDLEEAINMDHECMNWNRERLLRRKFAESGDLCYVARENGKLVGFVMADRYRQEIGPLICRTNRDGEAISLLKTALGKLVDVEVGIGVSEKKPRIADALVAMNFKEEFRVTLMHLGEAMPKTRCMVAMESLERS
jgi:ribosomal protein S18 acetylase RimI-like enzyme